MRLPSSQLPTIRLRLARHRLLCLLRLPRVVTATTRSREYVLVLSLEAPFFRLLTVYRSPRFLPLLPEGTHRAA